MRIAAALLCAWMAVPAVGQEQTLADIRQELTVLFVELQGLKRELSTSGGAQTDLAGDTLQRVDQIERALQQLTARTEALEFRIDRVVRDGSNRIGDLEFRLCELEAACDIGALGPTPSLGADAAESAPPPPQATPIAPVAAANTVELAVGERADFEAALAQLNAGEAAAAADGFSHFTDAYPGSPLTPEAYFHKGKALALLGRHRDAGLAYLDSYSGAPTSPVADAALLGLGVSLGKLNQIPEACATLAEVGTRFPGSAQVAVAQSERARLGCS